MEALVSPGDLVEQLLAALGVEYRAPGEHVDEHLGIVAVSDHEVSGQSNAFELVADALADGDGEHGKADRNAGAPAHDLVQK